jgi:uncharacterized protein YdeI (YjbR/CyaY-like superfamily)
MTRKSTGSLKRPRQHMPAFVRRALDERGLADAYRSRPPYQRNDYLWWINDAKREATKEKRLGQNCSAAACTWACAGAAADG